MVILLVHTMFISLFPAVSGFHFVANKLSLQIHKVVNNVQITVGSLKKVAKENSDIQRCLDVTLSNKLNKSSAFTEEEYWSLFFS